MRALLVHQRLDVALDDESSSKKPMKVTEEELSEVLDRAHSATILSLGDGVLREMEEGSLITDHIDAFNKIILDLEDINVKIDDEDKAMILLCSLSSSYENLVDTLMYGRQTFAMGDVKEALSSKAAIKKEIRDGEGLTASRRTEKKDTSKNRNKGSKSRPKNLKCFHCHKEGHFKKDCPKLKNKKNNTKEKSGDAAVASKFEESYGYDSAGVLIATDAQTKDCVLRKSSRVKFSTGIHNSKGTLDYIQADLWGLAKTTSLGGARYFLSLFDDFSRMIWVFSLKSKDKVFDQFKNWKTLIETQTNRKVRRLRTDNGLEFCNKDFDDFYTKHGMVRHKTVRHTPQQNGLAQRMNRTLIDKVRCMLIHSKLPMSLWAEALDTACYIVNRSPSSGINFRTPYELWSGKPADYSHLRIFGCPAYAHVKQGKLKLRAFKCVFLGYPAGVKGYKLWCIDMKPPRAMSSGNPVSDKRKSGFEAESIRIKSEIPDLDKRKSGCWAPWKGLDSEILKQIVGELQNELDLSFYSLSSKTIRYSHFGRNRITGYGHPEFRLIDLSEQEDELEGDDDLRDYQLVRDRKKRESKPPKRYAYADLIAFALSTTQGIEEDEPKTYTEAVSSKDSKKWIAAVG
ncbi:hypothetical protein WN943_024869 [Citrus x changshan-huyou]